MSAGRKKSCSALQAFGCGDTRLSAAVNARLLAAARLELARALHHLDRARKRRGDLPVAPKPKPKPTKVGHMTPMIGMSISDIPAEMSAFADGVSDDASFTPEIVGCNSKCNEQVSGLPSYLFTKRNLSNLQVRQRIGQAIRHMTPKVRRRVILRLKQAIFAARVIDRNRARVSGAVRSITPSVGWTGVTVGQNVAVRRSSCPYANVAGAFTP